MSGESCCTCASLLENVRDEKPSPTAALLQPRRLNCCGRVICGRCVQNRPQFARYCPYCQLSDGPSALPQGLRDPPVYSVLPAKPQVETQSRHLDEAEDGGQPPAYCPRDPRGTSSAQTESTVDRSADIIHFLRPSDTIISLSLAYSIPSNSLRSHNSLYSDHLLTARKTISIPRALYSGPSLSPHTIESQEESERKSSIRRFMVRTKCHNYDIAELYVKQANGDLEQAVDTWAGDEKWEKDNPFDSRKKGKSPAKSKTAFYNAEGGLVGQLR